jgi:hypothetical protein
MQKEFLAIARRRGTGHEIVKLLVVNLLEKSMQFS